MKIIKAPAKINIVLRVLGRRSNGYHDLLMLNEELNSAKKESNSGVNNGSRSNKQGKTPNGYTPPDWAKDSLNIGK